MLEFFRGWKRKLGCVTLVMACVLLGIWVRSYYMVDTITQIAGKVHRQLLCTQGRVTFHWTVIPAEVVDEISNEPSQWLSFPINDLDKEARTALTEVGAGYLGFFFLQFRESPDSPPIGGNCRIPYWSIVLPLTVVSGWLLLSKPRTRIKPSITPASENA